jgi:hypothetical protein
MLLEPGGEDQKEDRIRGEKPTALETTLSVPSGLTLANDTFQWKSQLPQYLLFLGKLLKDRGVFWKVSCGT